VKVSPTSLTTLLAALLWVAALLIDPRPFAAKSVLLIGVGLLATACVAVVGMILSGGVWARRCAVAVIVFTAVLAALRPIDTIWVVALAGSALSVSALLSRSSARSMRKLPSVSGPPALTVVLSVILLGFPALLGLSGWDRATTATVLVGLSAPVAAFWYARVLPGGLYGVRLVWPVLAVAMSPAQPPAAAIVSLTGAALVAAIAWQPSVKLAFHPPREVGTSYPIPPELAPREVLDTARLDDKGRPRP